MQKQNPPHCSHLASQTIDETGPGSILVDFEMLLGFVEDGVRSTGKYHLLPMARLFELDQLMTKPLRPRLKRPQQRSFPHLNGLYLLLRATQLGVPEGHGKTSGQLTLDADLHKQWLQLNATERYFNLLEAWLRHSCWEAVGLNGGGWMSRVALNARELWTSIPADGRRFADKKQTSRDFLYNVERSCTLALLELFGLMTVEREEPEEGQSWRVTEVRHTPFGDELLAIVFNEMDRDLFAREKSAVDLGAWQPLLRSYFPQWVNNLKFAEPEFRDGVYHFKVSLGEPWRRIAIPATSDLDNLAECIIRAFDFEGDHLYGFQFVARDGHRIRVEHPYVDDAETHTDEIAIGVLPLNEDQSMKFQYDFGADWRFDVQLEKIEPEGTEITKATIVESRGEAPAEYEFDEEW
jgi:hypothetical protein